MIKNHFNPLLDSNIQKLNDGSGQVYSNTLTLGSTEGKQTITHGLGTQEVLVQIWDSSGTLVGIDVSNRQDNSIDLEAFGTSESYTVYIFASNDFVIPLAKVESNTDPASAANTGSLRYRQDGNTVYLEVVIQTDTGTFVWYPLLESTWT